MWPPLVPGLTLLSHYPHHLLSQYPIILQLCNRFCLVTGEKQHHGDRISVPVCVGRQKFAPLHSVKLSDEVWAATLERAELESTTASEICERLLKHYLALEEKPPRYLLSSGATRRKRSVYVTRPIWAAAKAQKVQERRSISVILEQLLRGYLGLDLGSPVD